MLRNTWGFSRRCQDWETHAIEAFRPIIATLLSPTDNSGGLHLAALLPHA